MKTADLWVYDVIGKGFLDEGLTAESVRDDLKNAGDVDEIVMHINSPGGDVFEAIAVKSLLDNHPAKISVKVEGLSASAATILQMAGDTVEMAEGSMMMIHDPWTVTIGDVDEHLRNTDVLNKTAANIAKMYSQHGRKSVAEFREIMKAETWLTADEAVAVGLADAVASATAKAYKVPSYFGYS